jgi:hypothetical protein
MDQSGLQEASVSPLAVLFLVVMVVLTMRLPRRYAPMPLLITTAYMPLGQSFIVAGLHFQFFRVLLLVGVCRVIMRHEREDMVLSPLDRMFIWWGIAGVVLGTLAEFGWERFVNRAGDGFNAFIAYFLFRCWIRNLEDVIQTVKLLALTILPMAISMLVEKFTTRNIFAVFGGVPEITQIREGKLRCQGAFRHPILAGTYAATLFPLFVGLWFQPRIKKWIPIAGICGALIATIAASSSGALLASVAAVLGFALWGMRCKMHMIRWGIVLAIIALAIVMKAPVWYIPAKISDLMGGTGWHRSYLIDQAISHFNEWWLVGSAVTAHWAPAGQTLTVDPKNMDITNNYIAEGLGGGGDEAGAVYSNDRIFVQNCGPMDKGPGRRAVFPTDVCMVHGYLPVGALRFIFVDKLFRSDCGNVVLAPGGNVRAMSAADAKLGYAAGGRVFERTAKNTAGRGAWLTDCILPA